MTSTKERLGKAAGKVARAAGKAVVEAERKVEQKLRQRQRQRAMRRAGQAVTFAGATALAGATVEKAGKVVAERIAAHRAKKALGFEVHLPVDIEMAAARVTDALRAEGFGILTRIDVQATLQEKLDVDFRPYLILGACNPALAHRALASDTESGLLLPCNVTLEEVAEGNTVVRIADPAAMLRVGALNENQTIRLVAKEAESRLRRVVDQLASREHRT